MDKQSDVFRVANASVIGYVSGQELGAIVHYLDDFDPDLYVVFDGWNDLFGPFARIRSWPAPANLVGVQGAFFEIEKRLLAARQERSTKAPAKNEARPRTPALIDERAFFEAVATNYVRNIEKMADFCRARGARLVMVFQPELGHKENPSFTELGQLEYWNRAYGYVDRGFPETYEKLVEAVAARCEELEIPFVNLLESATINQSEETLFLDVVHLNETGHRMVAEEIMRRLRK
jgi:lysophospholipase L1-like esterase